MKLHSLFRAAGVCGVASALLFATAAAHADTAVLLPDGQRFADGDGTDFLLETTIPGDFPTPSAMGWE